MNYKILIIEDDEIIGNAMVSWLEKWGYQVRQVEDFQHIVEQVKEFQPELILLDINLPFYNGFYWCKEIRKFSKTPVVFLSSADDNMNIVMAMDMGGDDFIAKPFDLNVLTAKMNALLRRTYAYQGQLQIIQWKGVSLNLGESTMSCEEEKVELTKNEFRIMKVLMENGGNIVSRDTIMMELWENDDFIDDNTLTVNVTRLRKKLSEIGREQFISTKKGMGYLLEE